MEWVWQITEEYLRKDLARRGNEEPSDDEMERAFTSFLSQCTITVLVQEPWRGSVRFKMLARRSAAELFDLLNEPVHFLGHHYGGGKFKLNFHRGLSFVATKNFKPEGEPKWQSMPELSA